MSAGTLNLQQGEKAQCDIRKNERTLNENNIMISGHVKKQSPSFPNANQQSFGKPGNF